MTALHGVVFFGVEALREQEDVGETDELCECENAGVLRFGSSSRRRSEISSPFLSSTERSLPTWQGVRDGVLTRALFTKVPFSDRSSRKTL